MLITYKLNLNKLSNPGFPTWESSEGWGGESRRGTDGRVNGNYWDGSCTHTSAEEENVWRVDLIDKYQIDRIVIHNREDCCGDRIDGAQVCKIK